MKIQKARERGGEGVAEREGEELTPSYVGAGGRRWEERGNFALSRGRLKGN